MIHSLKTSRLKELDFLRGLAIILVLLRHQDLFEFTKTMGWIGVDLFFVLSGFLVSGLLFKEYIKFGSIKPALFLIRRGFKIYPIYFLFYPLYLYPKIITGNFDITGFLSDMTFIQNYVFGFGWAYQASWSLAVEEHFYLLFSFLLYMGIKRNKIVLQKSDSNKYERNFLVTTIVIMLIVCLFLRIFFISALHFSYPKNFTMTHLRIDSLLAGVLVSYFYYFRVNYLTKVFRSYKYLLLLIMVSGIAWTPFIDPQSSFFVKTFGFTLIYISFGILLICFLFTTNIVQKLNTVFSAPVVNFISKIGFCSYSIYIIHTFINRLIWQVVILRFSLENNHYFNFILTSVLSIIIGMFMTHKIEKYFLKVRDTFFSSRI